MSKHAPTCVCPTCQFEREREKAKRSAINPLTRIERDKLAQEVKA